MSSTMFMDPGNTLENRRQQRIAFARREWSELPAKDLDQVSGYVVDKASGNLFRPVTSAVLPGDVFGHGPKVDAFYVSHSSGEPVYLVRSQSPATLDELRAQEAEQERQRREHERAVAVARSKFLAKQKRLPLTLSEVEGRELPTLAGAHQTLVDLGCEVTTNNGTLRIAVPERLRENDAEDLSARQAIHAASKLLDYARDVVVAHLQANQELPSGPITIGGGAVR